MAGAVTQDLLGVEDVSRHVPSSGSAAQTFARASRLGAGTTPITKLSAANVPTLDAAVVSGANTPFAEITHTTTEPSVESCLVDIRKNYAEMKNFDHYGGIPGTGISAANAQKNTEVFNRILADMATESQFNGIFFPQGTYEFMETGGFMPRVDLVDSLRLAGTGPGSILRRNASASTAQDLLSFLDSPNATISDLYFDRNGTTGSSGCLSFTGAGVSQIGGVKVLNCLFSGGVIQLLLGESGFAMDNFWVFGSVFSGASSLNLEAVSASNGHFRDNQFQNGGTGILVATAGGTDLLRDIDIVGNVLTGTGMGINAVRGGTFTAANHRGIAILDNKITSGNIDITGVDSPLVQNNRLAAGKIAAAFDNAMVNAKNARFIGNEVIGSSAAGITLSGTTTTLKGFEIQGGKIENSTTNGIAIQFSGAPARGGRISGVYVLNASRQDTGTDHTAVLLDAPGGGAGGVLDTLVVDNVIRCDTATAGGRKHKYGVQEVGGGASNKNMIGPNFTQGYVTADVAITGAASLDVVAGIAALALYDAGAAV